MSSLAQIVAAFGTNIRGVEKLVNFDRDLLGFTITQLQDLQSRLKEQGYDNPGLKVGRTLEIISQVRRNDSLRPRYSTIFNQAIVLLVSYFASTLGDMFRYGISAKLENEDTGAIFDEEIKFTLLELKERDWNLRGVAPDLLIAKKDLTFQDMRATHRAFKTYLDVTVDRDRQVNNIILAQACRHAIVHAGGQVTDRTIRQLASALPRDVKTDLEVGIPLQFEPEEVEFIANEMQLYIESLASKIEGVHSGSG